ncbi:MAG TPA: winged helix-turn-helix domain-containing protein [Dehalococcoidia bacterium]|nr:winged helix-turn-helix domain-containing protein [Dehalococcoidia bacterium]
MITIIMNKNSTMIHNHWYLVSSHGSVLFYIAVHPECTIRQIADEMALTQRTVWGLIGDLRRAGMLNVRRDGRRHHYTVNLDAPFRHPILKDLTLRVVLGELVDRISGNSHRFSQREAGVA